MFSSRTITTRYINTVILPSNLQIVKTNPNINLNITNNTLLEINTSEQVSGPYMPLSTEIEASFPVSMTQSDITNVVNAIVQNTGKTIGQENITVNTKKQLIGIVFFLATPVNLLNIRQKISELSYISLNNISIIEKSSYIFGSTYEINIDDTFEKIENLVSNYINTINHSVVTTHQNVSNLMIQNYDIISTLNLILDENLYLSQISTQSIQYILESQNLYLNIQYATGLQPSTIQINPNSQTPTNIITSSLFSSMVTGWELETNQNLLKFKKSNTNVEYTFEGASGDTFFDETSMNSFPIENGEWEIFTTSSQLSIVWNDYEQFEILIGIPEVSVTEKPSGLSIDNWVISGSITNLSFWNYDGSVWNEIIVLS